MTALAVIAALFVGPAAETVCSRACVKRVQVRETTAKWRRAVERYGVGLLRARARCESGSHGMYRLVTTGNSYWFAHQLNVQAWVGAGGRLRHGRPVGVWSMQPSRLEQDYRSVRWDWIHGGDPWPRCP